LLEFYRDHWNDVLAAAFKGVLDCFAWAAVTFGLGSLPLLFQYYRSTVSGQRAAWVMAYPEIWVYIIAISISVISAAVVERTRPSSMASIAVIGGAYALAFASFAYAGTSHSLLAPPQAEFARDTLVGVSLLAIFFILPEKIGDSLKNITSS
jgi:hypothetical protein